MSAINELMRQIRAKVTKPTLRETVMGTEQSDVIVLLIGREQGVQILDELIEIQQLKNAIEKIANPQLGRPN